MTFCPGNIFSVWHVIPDFFIFFLRLFISYTKFWFFLDFLILFLIIWFFSNFLFFSDFQIFSVFLIFSWLFDFFLIFFQFFHLFFSVFLFFFFRFFFQNVWFFFWFFVETYESFSSDLPLENAAHSEIHQNFLGYSPGIILACRIVFCFTMHSGTLLLVCVCEMSMYQIRSTNSNCSGQDFKL